MAPKSQVGRIPVDAIKHGDKRVNIPSADDRAFVDEEIRAIRQVRYTRDESLDPQLVWRTKYPSADKIDDTDLDLLADAPPIYIQEKIDPRVLIESLRHSAARTEEEPELTLFETFDGLNELDAVEYYQHAANWSNRMILGDSLQVMSSLAEREQLRGQVQMVYIDPPYGIKFGSNWQPRIGAREVKDGNLTDAAREAEQIKAFRDTWRLGIHSYLEYLRDRFLVARNLLAQTGSCFVQIGDENVHLVRALMDEVFGSENFVSQIIFKKTAGATSRFLPPTADHIVWYAVDIGQMKYRTPLRARAGLEDADSSYAFVDLYGERRRLTDRERRGLDPLPNQARIYRQQILTSPRVRASRTGYFPVRVNDRDYLPTTGEWKTHQGGMAKLVMAGRVIASERALSYVRYLDDFPAIEISNVWDDTQTGSGMDKIYVVQSSAKVVQRCMLMCTDPGDLVLDPTCGSGTTAYVAEQWGRRWITIDTSRVALALARQRLMGAKYPWYLLADSADGYAKEQSLAAEVLPRRTFGLDIRQGFVYERVQRVTLKSIANNPDIREGMTRNEIDAAIKRHADFEVLYDRPYEDKNKIRVTGPFTVESLSPHRSLAFARGIGDESLGETEAAKEPDAPSFEQTILDNLSKAGIQNGRKNERITFAAFETYAGEYVQAVGQRDVGDQADAPSRIGIAIGPQYGTVSASFAKNAAHEAIMADNIDLLCILAFAFDPQVTGVTEAGGVTVEVSGEGFANVAGVRKLGRIPVLMVRMNVDLLMGEALKKSGAGNLFTVFGEPDIELRETSDGCVAEIKGVDVYDPTTDEVRNSRGTSDIALWMIDTDYNEESFFVRHCYFTGDNDPYKRLKTALKADIDAEAWNSLYKTVSRPFPKPSTGKIAIKVINDYGDEVMKVFNA